MRHVKVSRQLFQEPLQYAYWDRRRQLDAIRCNIASRMQWKFKFVVSLCCCPTWWWGSSSSRAHQACRGVKRHEKSDELSKQHKKSILLSRSIDFIGGQRTKHEHIFHTQNTNRLLLASPERDFNENQCFFSPAICISLWRILIEWTTRFYFFLPSPSSASNTQKSSKSISRNVKLTSEAAAIIWNALDSDFNSPKTSGALVCDGAGKKFKFNDIQISAKIINLVMAVRSVARESSNLYVNWICSRNQRRGESESASASPCDALKFY